jgi:hypothetical protein
MEVSEINASSELRLKDISKTTVDLNTQELHLETFPMPTVLRHFRIQTTRGIATAMAIEADVGILQTKE